MCELGFIGPMTVLHRFPLFQVTALIAPGKPE